MSDKLSSVVCELVLDAMALVVVVDDEGEDQESSEVARAYEEITGRVLDDATWSAALTTARAEPKLLWEKMEQHRSLLIPPEKDVVVSAVVKVCVADAELQEEELALLSKLARTLGVPGAQLRQVMNQTWKELRNR